MVFVKTESIYSVQFGSKALMSIYLYYMPYQEMYCMLGIE